MSRLRQFLVLLAVLIIIVISVVAPVKIGSVSEVKRVEKIIFNNSDVSLLTDDFLIHHESKKIPNYLKLNVNRVKELESEKGGESLSYIRMGYIEGFSPKRIEVIVETQSNKILWGRVSAL